MTDSAHIAALKNQARLKKFSANRFRVVKGRMEIYTADVSNADTVAAAAIQAEMENVQPGGFVEGKGIFVGEWTPKRRDGTSLSKKFRVYAAKKDLIDEPSGIEAFSFDVAIRRIANLKGLHGHDGAHYRTDTDLINGLDSGDYNGGWVMPPIELLSGYNLDDNYVQADNLESRKGAGELIDAFNHSYKGRALHFWYWSLSTPGDNALASRAFKFADGSRDWLSKDRSVRCRPVRMELVA